MLTLLRHLLTPAYLYALEDAPLGTLSWEQWAQVLALSVLALVGYRWHQSAKQNGLWCFPAGWFASLNLLSLALLIARTQLGGGLSARIWYLSSAGLALLGPLLYWAARYHWGYTARAIGSALALSLESRSTRLSFAHQIIILTSHAILLALCCPREPLYLWAILSAVPVLGWAAWVDAHSNESSGRGLRVELLSPLGLFYLSACALWLLESALGGDPQTYQAFHYPDPWSPLFDLRAMLLASWAWMLLGTASFGLRATRWRTSAWKWIGGALLGMALIWYGGTTVIHLSHGSSGSDPYCYEQMAIDWVEHGTMQHSFSLANMVSDANLPVWPTAHVGYHPPVVGMAATVWPAGWPALLAPLYAIGGEPLLLWGAPLSTILGALLALLWGIALSIDSTPQHAWLVGALAGALLLTSREAILRSWVPMADAAAQASSVLVMLGLVQAQRHDKVAWSLLAGVALALAYSIRHTQLLLALGFIPLLLGTQWSPKRRLQHALTFASAAVLCAVPDIWYRTRVFGSPLATESPEWFLISLRHIPATFAAIWRDGLVLRSEFGFLLPLVLYGVIQHIRMPETRLHAWALLLALAGCLGFQLCYSALRLRDLISLFPWLAFWAARGILTLWRKATASNHAGLLRTLLLGATIILLGARVATTLELPRDPIWTFGHITRSQRAGYLQLASQLPDGAIVATSLNSGAIERYTGHPTIRPATWTDQEFQSFQHLLSNRHSLYLLDDGEEMEMFLTRVSAHSRLVPMGMFDLPTFGLGGQDYARPATLYAIIP